jgi:tetratricopeptide (TPR) repeat protein
MSQSKDGIKLNIKKSRKKKIYSCFVALALIFFSALPSHAQEEPIRALIEEAQEFFRQGLYDGAEANCKKAIVIDNRCIPAYNILGTIYAQKGGREREAISYFEESLRIRPDQVDVYNQVGFLYNGIGDIDESIKCMNKGLEYAPGDFQLNFNLGLTYLMYKQQADKAVDFLRKAERVNPKFDKLFFLLGLSYLALGDKAPALEFVTKLRKYKNEYLATTLEEAIRKYSQGQGLDMGKAVDDYSKQPTDKQKAKQEEKTEQGETQSLGVGKPTTKINAAGTLTLKTTYRPKDEEEESKIPDSTP